MTRELKLSLILGFSLVLVVTVLISDYLSKARTSRLDGTSPVAPVAAVPPKPEDLLTKEQAEAAERQVALQSQPETTVKTNFHNGSDFKPVTIPMGRSATPSTSANPKATQPADELKSGEAKPADAAAPAGERTHTIDDGDGLYAIARKYYGNGSLWEKLAAYNNLKPTAMLKVGSTIKIPPMEVLTGKPVKNSVPPMPLNAQSEPIEDGTKLALGNNKPEVSPLLGIDSEKPKTQPDAAKPKSGTYTVKKGDTLSQIAARQLGSSRRTDEILSLNKSVLQTPEDLQVGMVLKLPSK